MEEVKSYIANSVAPLYTSTSMASQIAQDTTPNPESLVIKCCEELCEAAGSMDLPQVYTCAICPTI